MKCKCAATAAHFARQRAGIPRHRAPVALDFQKNTVCGTVGLLMPAQLVRLLVGEHVE
jgi:hypothetical protein